MSEEYKGGEQGYGGDGPNVKLDDFVGRIVQDPSQPPELLLLSGYLGASSEEGHVRLYLDEELSRYVEIPQGAIRHTQELPAEQSPLGGSLVWIDRKAEVVHGKAGEERRKASFLEGQIAQDYIGGAAGEGGGGAAGLAVPITQGEQCQGRGILPTDMGPGCQSQFGPCISQFGPCPPRTFLPGCRTLTGIFCTRFGPACRRTLFEPGCTIVGPNCQTVLVKQCESSFPQCFTQPAQCPISVFTPCPPPWDAAIAAAQGAVAGTEPGGGTETRFCPSQVSVCRVSQFGQCPSIVGCPSRNVRCPSAVDACPTRFGCESQVGCFESQGCHPGGYGGGGYGGAQGYGAEGFGAPPGDCTTAPVKTRDVLCLEVTRHARCPSAVDACPTRFNCPSQAVAACQSQFVSCQSRFELCKTLGGPACVSINIPCVTRDASCESRGLCPSAVDACPTRFGCFNTQVCGVSQGCFPGGGFGPGGFGGGGGF